MCKETVSTCACNPSPIQGYRRRNAYIAAQSPMQSTVNDFWRMMWEFKSKVMVMLCNLNEEGQDACYPYWPAKVEQTIKYGKVLVTLTSQNSDDSDDYAIRKFTIQEESKVDLSSPPSPIPTVSDRPPPPDFLIFSSPPACHRGLHCDPVPSHRVAPAQPASLLLLPH